MLKIGITGGIGSGKTTVARFFEYMFQVPIYYSDIQSKLLLQSDKELIQSVQKEFGNHIYIDGQLDRKSLAQIVFNNEERLAMLNSLVHPAVERNFEQWCTPYESKPYILKEAALLFESGTYKNLDSVYSVSASEELRIARVTKRDSSTEAEVKARISKQWSEEQRNSHAQGIIYNNDESLLIPQLLLFHQQWSS
jgi:dephospho-CoA kinase